MYTKKGKSNVERTFHLYLTYIKKTSVERRRSNEGRIFDIPDIYKENTERRTSNVKRTLNLYLTYIKKMSDVRRMSNEGRKEPFSERDIFFKYI